MTRPASLRAGSKRSSALCFRKAPFWTPTNTACWLSSVALCTVRMPMLFENKKKEPLYSLQWLSQFLSGLSTCVGYAWLSGDQPRRLLFTWPSRGVSAPAGSAGHARALVVLPHLLPPSGFQLSGVRPRVPLLPPSHVWATPLDI